MALVFELGRQSRAFMYDKAEPVPLTLLRQLLNK